MREFRFFASIGPIQSARELGESARRAEAAGFDGILIPDHIVEILAPLPALSVVAALTDRLRVGTLVLNNDLRNPTVLAHELLTLDQLSGGRLIVGMGAGWNRPEYELAGIAFDPQPVRAARLEAAVLRLKELLQGRPGFPQPVQKPRPPILIGAGGRRLLEFGAREAEVVGLAPRISERGANSLSPAATDEKLGWIRAAAGDRFERLGIHAYSAYEGGAEILADPRPRAREIAGRLRARRGVEISEEEVLESPQVFLGSVHQLVEKFEQMRERWSISWISLPLQGFEPIVGRLAAR